MDNSDLCIAIGTRFTQIDTDSWSMKINQPLITISVDDLYLNKDYKSEKHLIGDLKNNLKALLEIIQVKRPAFERKEIIRQFKEEMENIEYPGLIKKFRK